jgi:hypothetical protein
MCWLSFENKTVDLYSFAVIVFWIYSDVRPLINYKNPITPCASPPWKMFARPV